MQSKRYPHVHVYYRSAVCSMSSLAPAARDNPLQQRRWPVEHHSCRGFAAASPFAAHQVHNALLEQVGWQIRRRLLGGITR